MWFSEAKEKKSKHQEFLDKHGIKSTSIGIGFSEKEQKWYGWSHRAIYGFGIGDEVKEGDCCASAAPGKALPVGFKAKTLNDAKKMAEAFAESVS